MYKKQARSSQPITGYHKDVAIKMRAGRMRLPIYNADAADLSECQSAEQK